MGCQIATKDSAADTFQLFFSLWFVKSIFRLFVVSWTNIQLVEIIVKDLTSQIEQQPTIKQCKSFAKDFNTWSTLKKCRFSPRYYIICQHLSIQTVKQSEFFYKVTTVRLQPNCTSSSAFWVELMSNCNDKGPCYTERWSFAAKNKVIGGGWAQNAEAAAIFILLINTKTSFCLLLRFWESVVFF